jgi:SHS2 domain-containing protein
MSDNPSINSAGTLRGVAFEEIKHTADRALRICGSDLRELLLNAAQGINSLLGAPCNAGTEPTAKAVELEAEDAEGLLVEWLSELAYWAESESLVFHRFDLHSLSPTQLKATIHGSRVTQLDNHIKAVTYHDLEIIQTEDGLTATVVFDV